MKLNMARSTRTRFRPNTIRSNMRTRVRPRGGRPRGGAGCIRLVLALGMALLAIVTFLGSKTINPITGEEQYITITKEQEITLGLQAAPEISRMYGGMEADPEAQDLVDYIGQRLVKNSTAARGDYPYEFHLLADHHKVNAFALPGGQIFITDALFRRLENDDQLAGVLAHEIGHVIARHGAQQIAQQELTSGLTGAVVLATYDPNNPRSMATAQVAMLIGNLVTMKYGRGDELESDYLGVCLMHQAGYNESQMLEVMRILEEASQGLRPPEFFSTHPNPENRIGEIKAAITNVDRCP